MNDNPVETATVRFGRLERRSILLGLTPPQLAVLTLATVIAVGGVYSGGAPRLGIAAVVWLPLAVAGVVSVHGRPVVEWAPLVANWRTRRLLGQTAQVTRPLEVFADLRVPGVPGRMRVTRSPVLGAALVAVPRDGTVVAIARVHGAGFVLDDPAGQEYKVAAWGRVLASLCQQPSVVRVQVVQRTVPGGAGPVRHWWREHALAGAPWASQVLSDLVEQSAALTRRQDTFIAVALRSPRGIGRSLTAAGIARIEQDLCGLADGWGTAEVVVDHWVSPDRLGAVLRAAYDPAGATSADDASENNSGPSLAAMGIEEHWSDLRTDSAWHTTYWVTQWPRSEVHPSFLQPLLLAPGASRTVTLIAEPLPMGAAMREIRRAKVEHAADAAQRARSGQVADEIARAEVDELARREQELIAGHGHLRFTGLVTVTAATLVELDAACAATEAAAAQSLCEIRRLVGQQGLAHLAAALPLARGVR